MVIPGGLSVPDVDAEQLGGRTCIFECFVNTPLRESRRCTARRQLVVGQCRMEAVSELERAERWNRGEEQPSSRQLRPEEVEVVPDVVTDQNQSCEACQDIPGDFIEGGRGVYVLLGDAVDVGGSDIALRVDESHVLVGPRPVCGHLDDCNLDDSITNQRGEAGGLQVDDGE